jgi:hypothetical protein
MAKLEYDFLSECGGVFLESFATTRPEQYASELASLRGIDADEIVWEPTDLFSKMEIE